MNTVDGSCDLCGEYGDYLVGYPERKIVYCEKHMEMVTAIARKDDAIEQALLLLLSLCNTEVASMPFDIVATVALVKRLQAERERLAVAHAQEVGSWKLPHRGVKEDKP